MKKTLLISLVLSFGLPAIQAQSFNWAKQIGGTNSDKSASITTDINGNIYTTGHFMNTVDFDPGAGVFNLSSAGGFDIYISKLDAAGNFVWAKRIGGPSNDEGLSVTTDANGNVYTTGYFQSTVDFNPNNSTANLTSAGGYDIFISKLDATGNFVWAKQLGGSGIDYSYSINTDILGNVYTTGHFRNTADFDPGANTFNLVSAGNRDIFISKLDASGSFLWAKQLAGSGFDNGFSISTDVSGNVYATGSFRDTVDFDPGPGNFNLIATGGSDIYIAKLDAAGNFRWAKKIGGINNDAGISITSSASGNVYTTGYFYGTIDFNPGVGTFLLSAAGSRDIFISKLDSIGNFVWAKRLGGISDDRGFSIITDTSDNVYTTGFFENTADFDPGTATFNLTSLGNSDVFITKLNASGNLMWVKQVGGVDDDYGVSLDIDASGNIYTTGYFENTADFDPDTSAFNLTSNGSWDAFIHKLSQCPVARSTEIISACDSFTWVDGNTYNASTNTPTFNLIGGAANGCDSLITLNLTINNSSTRSDIISACNSYTWVDGNTYTASTNTPTFNLIGGAANGCDSLVNLNLTINNSSLRTDIVLACDSFTWVDGNTYTASTNSPTFNLIGGAANGCDSLLSLNLTIRNSSAGTDIISACDSFTWIDGNTYTTSTNTPTFNLIGGAANGCDSLVNLNLTINNNSTGSDIITACDNYTWVDGNTYTTSTNTPTFNLIGGAANGCDSLVNLNLTIDSVSNISTTTNGTSISANLIANRYQWLDCDNDYAIIPGEISQLFTATANGNYAVELTENGCLDTSTCITINTVSAFENTLVDPQFTVYPNPTSGQFSITLGTKHARVTLLVRNALGQKIIRKSYHSREKIDLTIEGSPGIYFLEIFNGQQTTVQKLIKK